ncbi:conserved hypothetical protein [Treponema phagedenis]|uniref:Uncharacterized protein n=1 Tax=Treponema phagedenis TaxID=162 RepID=A0A0B7GWA7_TREPH|nr:hypothetical protein HMPREF9554_03182 [Treponema phagedenis F0421]CEM61842.1 conserved hypothetical protein [Treponema phagedenis]
MYFFQPWRYSIKKIKKRQLPAAELFSVESFIDYNKVQRFFNKSIRF